ncbi:mycofactocin-coupled SDR family oxidoreductase [Streptomyces blattellae]|uniref:mycofactocin-coupled SDR family oxidoreductase n=1 Tax=Streptomyces blattellae TaxID=2569855 RepID=UPI0012B91079|nr:mycofactocin-coupled SDR family oxidoreductase [Streptomyces blattellae]
MGKLDGKTVMITGAARGQGRSHAVTLAEEGANILALDICADIETLSYGLATADDLAETVKLVEATGARAVGLQADVRDADALRQAVDQGTAELGDIDIVIANAGVAGHGSDHPDQEQVFRDVIDVNLRGVWNTVHSVVPRMIERGAGGCFALVSSSHGLSGRGDNGTAGVDSYIAAKHGVVGLMRGFAHWLAPHMIRVNTVHPTGVPTPMVMNDGVQRYLTSDPRVVTEMANLLPVPMIEAADVSRALLWLVSDDARYVTGVALPVDAGFLTP